ncbi:hypothetical protein ACN28I_13620 [Archangium gephyra]|uniref:hypothetical protein n=1 Tax=Archangium gephyra TaxID=48 RepID=UPI003B7EFD0D
MSSRTRPWPAWASRRRSSTTSPRTSPAEKLDVLLEDLEPEPRTVHALFARQKSAVPKVRVFVDFLAELFGARPPHQAPRKRRG